MNWTYDETVASEAYQCLTFASVGYADATLKSSWENRCQFLIRGIAILSISSCSPMMVSIWIIRLEWLRSQTSFAGIL